MPPSLILPAILVLSISTFVPWITGTTTTDLNILLQLKQSLGIASESWSPTNPPCSFSGVTCNTADSVTAIDLPSTGLSGPLPPSLFHLPSLSRLSLPSNRLAGPVPNTLLNCTSLTHLDLSFNYLSGPVPDLSSLYQLQILNLSDNALSGQFPYSSLPNLTALRFLSLGDNPFAPAPFPSTILSLVDLYQLYLSDTNLQGEIPADIGNLTNLLDLELSDNFLTGGIPPTIAKLKKLRMLELYNSSLFGPLPPGFGNLTELQFFDASMNAFEGDLSELRLLRNLVSLQLFYNNFSGEIPPEFGEFRQLVNMSIYSNSLSGELPEKLGSWTEFDFIDVSTNYFTGRIPPDMCKMGTMRKLLMLENNFTGEIPATYADCSSLTRFRVSNNSLSGAVPAGIWSLPNVNIIDVAANQLDGPVTAGIRNAKSLYQLFINDNRFSGQLPVEISGASSLVEIEAGSNQFSGWIPASIGELKHLNSLVLEKNGLSGEIPNTIGSCSALSAVNLAVNSLTGPIPASLGELQRLNSLDLSGNQLTGEIPPSLSSLKLSALNLSDNRLTGTVPPTLSSGAYSRSFTGNPGLCGNDVSYLRQCSPSSRESSGMVRTILVCFLAAFATLLASLGLLIFIKRRRVVRPDSVIGRATGRKDSWDLKSFRVLSFNEQEIIDSIRIENVIGKGGSGNVYRVVLGSSMIVAVKHIWNTPDAAAECGGPALRSTAAMLTRRSSSARSREFETEVGTLSAIRHVNVVKLYCSITSEDSSLLVYEYLDNGSLWDRLHGPEGVKMGLDWEARYEVAVGSARGLEYLHHGCDRPILHRDVKSSNILLDEWFKPRIADFGLAKILHAGAVGKDESTTHVVAGTHGYIAPEYAYTWRVNEKSDVYSFGVVLMELVTGRRPIEPEYGDNKDIVDWVSVHLTSRDSVMTVVDRRFGEAEREEAVKVLRVGVLCASRLPSTRPSMRKVVQMLEAIGKSRIVDARSYKGDDGGDDSNSYKSEAKIKVRPSPDI